MPREKFSKVFRDRLDEIERDALAHGSSMSEICEGAKISRATPYRWFKRPPKTIEIIDVMEKVLAKIKKKKGFKE